ncbi:MAG: hypothetical protein K1X57_11885 [Gemmataceae bacterium]|nr:hypothetical protein [Gemmataceae bacterium]
MRRWLTIASLLVLPWLSGCCCHLSPCGERLFNRPCLFGKCGGRGCDACGGVGVYTGAAYYGGTAVGGCPSCGGGAVAPGGVPVYPGTPGTVPAPMPSGPAVGAPPIEKLTAVPPAQTVPTRIIR